MPIKSSDSKLTSCSLILIDAQIEVMFTLPIKWTSTRSLGWIALPPHSSLMKCKDSYLRRGELKETHFPRDRTRNRSFGPQSYTSSFTMGPWICSSCSIWRSSHSLHEHEVLFRFITKVMLILEVSEIFHRLCQVAASFTITLGLTPFTMVVFGFNYHNIFAGLVVVFVH